jgi:arylsulfatase
MKKTTHLWMALLAGTFLYSCKNESDKPSQATAAGKKPNVLIIVGDDLGYSDVASFGGNIATPTLDALSNEGVRFSNFHVLPTCSPTRSALLTGNDNHVAGMGVMEETIYPALDALQLPGYAGYLSNQVTTIPEVLSQAGYHTYMTGKWHLGEGEGKDPHDRGFEETFILGTGGGSHWDDRKALAPPQHMEYTRNGKVVDPPADFYSSKNYTDSMLQFIDRNKKDGKPFFGFLSYTAVHDPLHAPAPYIAKYKGRFDMGWDSLWTLRLKNLQQLGVVSKDLNKFSKNPSIPQWKSLPKEQQQEFARDMEVYAGMLDYMDSCIGEVFNYLKKEGMYDNTMIIFMSDNGANGANAHGYPGNEDGKYLATFDNKLENRGLQNSFVEQGPGWAQASSAPFRYFKSFTTEGGIRAPLIVKMPGTMQQAGQWNRSFFHVTDIMPTILELAGVSYPAKRNEVDLHPLIGKSMLPVLQGKAEAIHTEDGMGWELFEMKAYIKGNWKILRLPKPFGTGEWQLFDIEKDPAETTDLSAQYQSTKDSLIGMWNEYAKANALHDHNGHFDSIYRRNYNVDKE